MGNVPFFDRFAFCMEENIGQRILSKDLENIVKKVASGKTLTNSERTLIEANTAKKKNPFDMQKLLWN